jgi:hypothetical protein
MSDEVDRYIARAGLGGLYETLKATDPEFLDQIDKQTKQDIVCHINNIANNMITARQFSMEPFKMAMWDMYNYYHPSDALRSEVLDEIRECAAVTAAVITVATFIDSNPTSYKEVVEVIRRDIQNPSVVTKVISALEAIYGSPATATNQDGVGNQASGSSNE